MPTLQEIFEHEIQDLYSAESQLVAALPKMEKAASSEKLAEAFRNHTEQTKEHKNRIEQVAQLLGVSAKAETCKAMKGLVEEGQSIIEEFDQSLPRDAALIAAAQRVEHYEISAYGSALAMAQALGLEEVAAILESTLNEEKETDVLLTDISVGEILPNALADEGAGADPNQSGPTRQPSEDDGEDDDSGRKGNAKSGGGKKNGASKAKKNEKSSTNDLESKTKEELYQMAQEQDLEGRSSMSKDELIKALA